jgi:hypothetical protein
VIAFIQISPAWTQDHQSSVQDLKDQLDALKADYEKRIVDLEKQIEELQIKMLQEPLPEAAAQPVQPAVQTSAAAFNPAISIVGNFLGRGDADKVFNEEGDRIDNKLNLREVEIDFRAAVDPYADAVMIAALESEFPGEFEASIEEGYVTLKALPILESPPLGLRFKVGRFRPLFGRTNILHTHDLPTSFHPLPVEEFLGEEGFIQNGVSAKFFIPTPWDANSSLDATVEVMDGGEIALSPQSEARVSYLAHLRWFRTFADVNNIELGWSGYFHPSGNNVGSANAQSIDFLYRWRPLRQGQWKSYLLGAEFFYAPETTVEEVSEQPEVEDPNGTPKGFTAFTQWQFNRRMYSGIRYDWTQTLLNPDFQRQSITPYISYYFSEFLRFRFNYEHRWSDLLEEDGRNAVFFELNWIFGAHPPEPFWVNK